MSRYPNESVARFDGQFYETTQERNDRLREARENRNRVILLQLIADLSGYLTGPETDSVVALRRRVANTLPPDKCPDWLASYRDPPVVQS